MVLAWTTPEGDFKVDWYITNSTITFNVTASTTGWVGLGLNSVPLMTGADMYTGWVNDANGNVTLLDTFSTGQVIPVQDATSNIYNVSGTQVSN